LNLSGRGSVEGIMRVPRLTGPIGFTRKVIIGYLVVGLLVLSLLGLFSFVLGRYQRATNLVFLLQEAKNADQALRISLLSENAAMEEYLVRKDPRLLERLKEGANHSRELIEHSLETERKLAAALESLSFAKERLASLESFREDLLRQEEAFAELSRLAGNPGADPQAIYARESAVESVVSRRISQIDARWSENIDGAIASIQGEKNRDISLVLVLSAAILVALTILSLSLVNVTNRTIHRLVEGMDNLAAGNLNQTILPSPDADLNRLVEKFNRMSEELTRLDEIRRDFVSMLSHDLRSPLSVVKMYSEILREKGTEPVAVEAISRNADRLLGIVNNFLDYSRAEAGTLTVSPLPIELAAMAAEVIEDQRLVARSHEVTLSADIPPSIRVMADPPQLERVLTNLIGNAIKYNRPGGTVALTAAFAEGSVKVAVSDTGMGISESDIPNLFVKYSRPERTRHIGGTGLGLVVSRAIIKAHGSDLEVVSGEGTGTTFSFRLPTPPTAGSEPAPVGSA
jgi:signal transduction histidine kinase